MSDTNFLTKGLREKRRSSTSYSFLTVSAIKDEVSVKLLSIHPMAHIPSVPNLHTARIQLFRNFLSDILYM
jgi:hypothetical protein